VLSHDRDFVRFSFEEVLMSVPAIRLSVAPKYAQSRVTTAASLKVMVLEWLRRSRSRTELAKMTDRDCRDLGYTRCDVDAEAAKPFWNP
jgi:uncharacterized protein YjiS (DUF1127 family)